ncbi:MAG: GreA/GreB family elongation factor [Phycisphaerae bacterium]
MNVRELKRAAATGQVNMVESAWMDALSSRIDPQGANEILSVLVEKGRTDTAETLASLAMEETAGKLDDKQRLELAKALLLAVPSSDELRQTTAELYQSVHGDHPRFEAIFEQAGLTGGQSPRRAVRTLDICLALTEDTYMANRFEDRIIHVQGFNEISQEFEFTETGGSADSLDPKRLADEFDILDEDDFRARKIRDPEQLAKDFKKDPGSVLLGLCKAHGGQVTSDELKDDLVGTYFKQSDWSRWWSRARSAAKKSTQLAIEGRNPVIITHHPGGLSLEKEMAGQLKAAKTSEAYLAVIRDYAKQLSSRGDEPSESFTRQITEGIALQVRRLLNHRPADALTAALALQEAMRLGAPEPKDNVPTPAEVLQLTKWPAEAIANVDDYALWPEALEGLKSRPDAAAQAAELLTEAPESQIDGVLELLNELDGAELLPGVIEAALADPVKHVELCCWLWNNRNPQIELPISKLEVLGRLLRTSFELEHHHHETDRAFKRDSQQSIRNALSARNYRTYRETIEQMDTGTAATIRRRIERTGGLAQAVHDEMLSILRQSFPQMFIKAQVDPWLDETVIYTTAKALEKHKEELRVLNEVDIPANAKQIGEAAAQGDLRENADWQAAIEERDMLAARAKKIADEIALSRTIDPDSISTESVGIGSKVQLTRTDTGERVEMTFLGPWDTNLEANIYAYTTKLGQALMGLAVGDTATIPLQGSPVEVRVESIQKGL